MRGKSRRLTDKLCQPIPFERGVLWGALLSVLWATSLQLVLPNQLHNLQVKSNSDSLAMVSQRDPEVLGWGGAEDKAIFISDQKGYASGGVISLGSQDVPAVNVRSWNLKGPIKIRVFQSDQSQLLAYLVHDEQFKQTKADPIPDPAKFITEVEHRLSSQENDPVLLPLDNLGIYLVEVKKDDLVEYAFVIRSDFGVVLKEADQEYLFWGQDFQTLRSINQGVVRLYNLQGEARELTATSVNDQGIATTSLLPEADIAIMERNGVMAMVPVNMEYINSGNPWRRFQEQKANSKYFVFTDRPIYQPGDTVYFKVFARKDRDVAYSIPGGVLSASLTNGYGQAAEKIWQEKLSLSDLGSADGKIDLPKDLKSDYYSINISSSDWIPRNEWDLHEASVGINVQPFRKPEYSVEMNVERREYIRGEVMRYTITGNYFSGQPVSGATVEYRLTEADWYDYGYEISYQNILDDGRYYGNYYGEEYKKGTVTLDNQGMATLEIPANYPGGEARIFTMSVQLKERGNEPSEASINTIVYPGEFGIYRRGYDHRWQVGQEKEMELVLKPHRSDVVVHGLEVKAALTRTVWEAVYAENSKYPHYTEINEAAGEIKTITDVDGIAKIKFKPEKSGSYHLSVSTNDTSGREIRREHFVWVAKKGEYVGYSNNDEGLSVMQDKDVYEPNETMSLSLSSGIANRDVLLTAERDFVHRYQVVQMQGLETEVNWPLETWDMPNIRVMANSFDTNWINSGSTEVMVSAERQRLNVEINTDKESYGPGESVTLEVMTKDRTNTPVAAEVAVWAVDKAIFELVSLESNKDIFKAFWDRRYSYTQMAHSLEGITAMAAEGGGGCFLSGTEVLMADGKTKSIETVQVGDRVKTRMSEAGESLVSGEVTSVHATTADGYLIINNLLEVTPNHMMWVSGTWKEAGSIQVGDWMLNQDDQAVPVESVAWQAGMVNVYNLEIGNYHTYFANGYWVHNQKGDTRQVMEDTAYWNPVVRTGADGKATVRFTLPDNLTTWVVAGVGATIDTKVGDVKKEIIVGKEVIVRPVMPNILRVGDVAELEASISNHSGAAREFAVDLEISGRGGSVEGAGGMEVVGYGSTGGTGSGESMGSTGGMEVVRYGSTESMGSMGVMSQEAVLGISDEQSAPVIMLDEAVKRVTIDSDSRAVVRWKVKADLVSEAVYFRIGAEATREDGVIIGDAIKLPIPVRTLGYWQQDSQAAEGNHEYVLEIHPDTNRELSKVQINLASTLLGSLPAAMEYLLGYPYGCVEQTTSRLLPAILVAEHPEMFAGLLKDKQLDKYVNKGLERLKEMQQQDGGWSWWVRNDQSDPFVSAYVAELLRRLQAVGYEVDPEIGSKLRMYFNQATFLTKSGVDDFKNAYVLKQYGLIMTGQQVAASPVTKDLDKLQPDLLAMAILVNLKLGIDNPDENGLALLLQKAIKQGESVHWSKGEMNRFGSVEASTAMGIKALIEGNIERQVVADAVRYLSRNRKEHYWYNSFATAQAMDAMVKFGQADDELSPNYSYYVQVGDRKIAQGSVSSSNQVLAPIELNLEELSTNEKVTIGYEGKGQLYSSMIVKEWREAKAVSQEGRGGISLKREYLKVGESNTPLALGDRVLVKFTVEGLQTNQNFGVIEDHLPAGMVPVANLDNESQNLVDRNTDWISLASGMEVTENGAVLPIYQMLPGKQVYAYQARVIAEGEFNTPPASVTLMYAPEIWARSASETIKLQIGQAWTGTTSLQRDYEINELTGLRAELASRGDFWLAMALFLLAWTMGLGAWALHKNGWKLDGWLRHKNQQNDLGDTVKSVKDINQPKSES